MTLTSRGRHLDCHTNAANVTSFTLCRSQHNHNLSLLLLGNVKLWSTFYRTNRATMSFDITAKNHQFLLLSCCLAPGEQCCLERWAARVYNLRLMITRRVDLLNWVIQNILPIMTSDGVIPHPARERITFTTSTLQMIFIDSLNNNDLVFVIIQITHGQWFINNIDFPRRYEYLKHMACLRRKDRIPQGGVDNTFEVDKNCHKLVARLSFESVHSKFHCHSLVKSLAFVQCYCCEFCQFIQNIEIHQQWHWKNALSIGSSEPRRIWKIQYLMTQTRKQHKRESLGKRY